MASWDGMLLILRYTTYLYSTIPTPIFLPFFPVFLHYGDSNMITINVNIMDPTNSVIDILVKQIKCNDPNRGKLLSCCEVGVK
jgi:hypothetical protein